MRNSALLDSQRRGFSVLEDQVLKSRLPAPRVLLRGPSGCGKSWILRELAERWVGPCLIAAGEPSLAGRSYAALWLGISEAGPKLSLEKAVTQGTTAAARGVPVVGSLVAYLTELLASNEGRQRRDQTLYLKNEEFEILSHLHAFSRGGKLMLIADDLQYWDRDSLQLLLLLLSGKLNDVFPFLTCCTIVVTLTDDQLDAPVSPLTDIIASFPSTVLLTPLTASEIPAALELFGFHAAISESQIATLHALCGGHLELLRQLAEHLKCRMGTSELTDLLKTVEASSGQFLATVLARRLQAAGENGRVVLDAMASAAVIGKSFSTDELNCLLGGSIAEKCIMTAQALGLLTPVGRSFSFQHDILRSCLLFHANPRLAASRRKFAECLAVLRPFDYFSRASHLLAAGALEDAARLNFAGCYKRFRDGLPVPSDLRAQIFDMLKATGQDASATLILQAHTLILERRFPEAVQLLNDCENIDHPMFVAERTHLVGLATLQSVVTSDRRAALAVLLRGIATGHGEKELELRMKLTLLTAFVHLEEWDHARRLDQEICTSLSLLQRTDAGARELLEMHRKKSGMLYGSEVAAERCRRAVDHFGPLPGADWPPRNPVQFFMALCNLSANLLVSGDFVGGDRFSRAALDTWQRLPRIKMPRVEKCMNNSVVAGVLTARIKPAEAVDLLAELRTQNPGGVFSRLIRSNCAVFRALAGNTAEALAEFQVLVDELERDQIEDEYYRYFVRSNLAGLLHVQGRRDDGREIWRELKGRVPRVPDSDRHYLVARQEMQAAAFDIVPPHDVEAWDNFLRNSKPSHLGPGWTFYGRGLLLTDTQIWLES